MKAPRSGAVSSRPIGQLDNVWIPMPDGARLAARIWLPEDAEADPVPAVLEYIPYRKGDATAARDAARHPWLAGHGYAAVRVDARGSGDSDGVLRDEYLPQELDDGVEVLRWLAGQPWCTGACGIVGKSWGGFNGLQIAALAPPELRAVLSVCSTDDRYADDVHYIGGSVLGTDMLSWATTMLAFNARPPDPAVVGDRWRAMWLERLEGSPPFVLEWLGHQRRDAYWRHGSACEDYAAIRCPVYMVGGWADPYRSAILRFLAGYPGPRKGLVGPWSHNYPDEGVPGPAIGFLQESLRWWDHSLKGVDTGLMDEPMLTVWMQDAVPPGPFHAVRPGRWVAEETWPSPRVEKTRWQLGDRVLVGATQASPAGSDASLAIWGSELCGLEAGPWIPWGNPADAPPDQRPDDGRSVCFDSAPLADRLELLGFPEVRLALTVDRTRALVAARLCDVAPDGSSLLVTRGVLNLTHRESHADPSPLEPGARTEATVRLSAIAHAFPAGHRIRLALSPAYWPWAWPSPEPVTLTVLAGEDSVLELPVRPTGGPIPAPFDEPEQSPPLAVEVEPATPPGRTVSVDLVTGRAEVAVDLDLFGTRKIVASGIEYAESGRDTFAIVDGDPLSAEARSAWTVRVGRGAWQTRVEARAVLTADGDSYRVENALDAFAGDEEVFSRTWTAAIPRDLA